MRRTILFLTAFLLSTALYCQTIELGIQSGIGTYGMKDLKLMNQSILHSIPFSVKMTSDFPAYLNYQGSLAFTQGKLNYGFVLGFQSTGSRISGKDYSGEFRYDMLIKSYYPGIDFGYTIDIKGKTYVKPTVLMGIANSNLKFVHYFRLADSTETIDMTVKALNYYFEPGIRLGYRFNKVRLELYTGYFVQFGKGEFHDPNDPDLILYGSNEKPVQAGWSGFRAGLVCVIPLFQINQSDGIFQQFFFR